MDDYSDVSGDPVSFPTSKTMKAHCCRMFPGAQFQSPARVFAKLKANVGGNTGGMQTCWKYGSELLTPKKGTDHRPDENWITHDTNTFDNNGTETISPTKSPHHNLPKSFSKRSGDTSSVKGTRHGLVDRNVFTQMKTLGQVSSQALLSHNATPSRSSNYIVRTPTKGQPLHAEFGRRTRLEPVVYLERCPLTMSPAKIFANMKDHACQPVRALGVDGKNDVDLELPGDESQSLISVDPSEPTNRLLVNDVPYDQSPSARCPVVSQDLRRHHSSNAYPSKRENLMSPAAKFSHMKERKMQQQQEADNIRSNTNDRRTEGCEGPSQKQPASTDLDQEGIKYGPNIDAFVHLQRLCPSYRFQPEGTRDPSENSRKDDAPVPTLEALVEDPLVIQSPHVFFPKKPLKSTFKRSPASEEQSKPKQLLPARKGGGYELVRWTIRFTGEGLYLDGIRTGDNIPWHSTVIVERISHCKLKTLSGRTYTLIGKMNVDEFSKLPKWLLNKFVWGFPVKWKMHLQHFLSWAKTEASSGSKARQTKCPVSAKPTADKTQRSPPFVTSSPPPPALKVSSFSLKTSRSGRLIKPPLEFWKGGRVSVDASMNVTIHEDYGTTVCMPLPKDQGGVFWRCGDVLRHSESTARPAVDQQPSVLQRTVKPGSCNQSAKTHQPPEDEICPVAKLQPRAASNSPEEVERHGAGRSFKRPRAPPQTGCNTGRHKPTKHGLKSTGSQGRKSVNKPGWEPAVPHSAASPSGEDVIVRRKGKKKGLLDAMQEKVLHSTVGGGTVLRKDIDEPETSKARGKGSSRPPKPAPAPAPTPATQRGDTSTAPQTGALQEEEAETWTEAELVRLEEAVASMPPEMGSFWVNVAMMVGTRSPEECQLTFQGCVNASSKKAKASKESTAAEETPAITARVGTLKRKQQVRQFIEAMPKDDYDDVFNSSSMQSKRFKMWPMSPSGERQDLVLSDLKPMTPEGARHLTVKTPPCRHVTPGMTRSVNSNSDDKYVYRIQQRLKKRQVNVCKLQLSPIKNFTLTPSVKQKIKKSGNMEDDSFVIRRMFPDNDGFHDDSEEEDLYFTTENDLE